MPVAKRLFRKRRIFVSATSATATCTSRAGRTRRTAAPPTGITDRIYDLVRKFHGPVSAEHGSGIQKTSYLSSSRTPEEISGMRQLRRLFDPAGILSRGRIFD